MRDILIKASGQMYELPTMRPLRIDIESMKRALSELCSFDAVPIRFPIAENLNVVKWRNDTFLIKRIPHNTQLRANFWTTRTAENGLVLGSPSIPSTIRELTFSFPHLDVYVIQMAHNSQYYIVGEEIEEHKLVGVPLPNVYKDCRVCMGHQYTPNPIHKTPIEEAFNLLWFTVFDRTALNIGGHSLTETYQWDAEGKQKAKNRYTGSFEDIDNTITQIVRVL